MLNSNYNDIANIFDKSIKYVETKLKKKPKNKKYSMKKQNKMITKIIRNHTNKNHCEMDYKIMYALDVAQKISNGTNIFWL